MWDAFESADSNDKELFAQIYTLLFFLKERNFFPVNVFRELSKHQDSRYNAWRKYDPGDPNWMGHEIGIMY